MPFIPFLDVRAPGFPSRDELVTTQLISFIYEESMYGCAKWAFSVRAPRCSQYDSFIKNDGHTGKTFRLRFGVLNDSPPTPPTGSLVSSWKTLELLVSRKRTLGEFTVFTFKGLCHGNALNRHRKIDGNWKEKKISEIVSQLVSEAGLGADVEETVGKYTLSSGKCSTGPFIKDYLLPLAYDKKGNKDWRLWVKDGSTVVFKPVNPNEAVKHFFTDRIKDNSRLLLMTRPEAVKTVASQIWDGSGRQRVELHDPKNNRFITYEVSDSNAGFKYGGPGQPIPRQGRTGTLDSTHFTEKRNLKDKTTEEQVTHVAETRFARDARGFYKMVSQVPFSVGMSPGDWVQVHCSDLFSPDESTGKWLLTMIRNVYTRGELKCFVMLERRWER